MVKFKIPVSVIKEGEKYIAYTPALDLSTSGKSHKEAKRRFEEIVDIFFEELIEKNTLEAALKNLGWQKMQRGWSVPRVISQGLKTICIPA